MDHLSLTLLVDILDAGNLSAAARKLKMSRANVSYRLNLLERELGVQLVRRTTRRMEPTEIGLKLAAHGRTIQHEMEAARDVVATMGHSPRGRIRLSVPSGYGQMVMARWLLDFKRAYPGIVLDVRFENRIVDLMQEEVDIAVRVVSDPPEHLVARRLGPVRYVACAASAYVQAHGLPTELRGLQDCAVVTSGAVGRQLRVAGTRDQVREEVVLEPTLISEHFPFLRQAVLDGLGIGLVPDYVVADCVASGAVQVALPDWQLSIFGTAMYLLYMPNRRHTLAASTLIAFLIERASADGRQDVLLVL